MRLFVVFASLVLMLPTLVWADSLSLRDGSRLEGDFLGGSPRELRFMVNGEIQTFSIDELDVLYFSGDGAAEESSSSRSADRKPVRQEPAAEVGRGSMEVMLPVGTRISAVVLEDLDSGLHRRGRRFEAALGADIMADGVVVAATGSKLVGRLTQVEKADVTRPSGRLVLELTGLYVDGFESLIATNTVEQSVSVDPAVQQERNYQQGARTGATIGALSGGSYGSVQRGAMVGGMMGWGAGEPVQAILFTNTILEFSLRQEVWLYLER